MHKASAEYFKQRSLYSRAELDRCQALSHQSDRKIRTAQVSVHIHVKTGRGGWLPKVAFRWWIPSFNFDAWCRFSSKRGRAAFIPQWLRSYYAWPLSGLRPGSWLPCVFFARQGRPGGRPLGALPPLKTPLLHYSPYVPSLDGWRDGWRVCLSTYAAALSRRRALPLPARLCVHSILCSVASH